MKQTEKSVGQEYLTTCHQVQNFSKFHFDMKQRTQDLDDGSWQEMHGGEQDG
jgi:hypothetical protein